MVLGGDSCSEGRGFESQHRIRDGYFFIKFDKLPKKLKKDKNVSCWSFKQNAHTI